MTFFDETYVIRAEDITEHEDNKSFLLERFPIGVPDGYTFTSNDEEKTITLIRVNVPWIPPRNE